jgi:hypothetical protein
MATRKAKYTGVIVDEFRVIAAAHSIMDGLDLLPSDGEICEFPKVKRARDHFQNALIDLSRCGIDVARDPSDPKSMAGEEMMP